MSAAAKDETSAGPAAASDEALLARVKANDHDAVAVLFDRYAVLFLSIAFRVLQDRWEAEDTVQEIFLEIFQRSNTFDPAKASGRTWMVQLAYSRSFDRRKFLHRRFVYGGTEIERLKNTLREVSRLEDEIVARLTGEQLREAFAELNEKQRATLELYFFEGCDLREVATRLDDTFENVRHYYYRGLDRLRRTTIALTLRNGRP
ncbi:MAG TPA: sigma-70 family RNA polymerase sigma factor [Candidatus Acidoferrum sp.]|nr:sigma-70 family RNA polymerase sigma factor [Candidatus Acidoferrum sp.]